MDLRAYLDQRRELVDNALSQVLPPDEAGGQILKAMRYSLFAGGKRVRPILCLAACEAVGGRMFLARWDRNVRRSAASPTEHG